MTQEEFNRAKEKIIARDEERQKKRKEKRDKKTEVIKKINDCLDTCPRNCLKRNREKYRLTCPTSCKTLQKLKKLGEELESLNKDVDITIKIKYNNLIKNKSNKKFIKFKQIKNKRRSKK